MKLLRPTLLFGVILISCASRDARAATPLATVRTSTGTTWVRAQNGQAMSALARRSPLFAGNVVGTGANGQLTLLFGDGAQIRLGGNSSVQITSPDRVGTNNRSLFRALSGRVWARLRPGNAIQTRTVALGVRGTEIHLDVQESDGTTSLTVVEGEVDFFNAKGAVVVGANQGSVARPGAAPTAPLTVGNAGFLIEWTADLDRAAVPREKFWVSLDPSKLRPQLLARQSRANGAPQNAKARRDVGDVLFDLRQYELALREYEAALGLDGRDPQILTRIGYALLELDRLPEAATFFRDAAKGVGGLTTVSDDGAQNVAHAPALTGLAWLQLERDRPQDAQVAAQNALSLLESQPQVQPAALGANDESSDEEDEARLALGVAQLRQPGQRGLAIETLENAARSSSNSRYAAHAWLALALLERNDSAGAVREGQRATQLQPFSALAHGHLALAHFFAGNGAASQKHAQTAVSLDPESPSARVALGQALLLRGDNDSAAREAALAVALDPKLPQAHFLLGVANAGRRDFAHARRDLQRSLDQSPDFLPAASALARVYNLMGQPAQAKNVVEAVLERNPQSDAALGAFGAVLYEQGDYRGAETRYREAIRLRPNSAQYHAELARTLSYSNRLSAAIEAGQTAVRLAPEVGQYHAILGLALDFGRLEAQAEREFRTALVYDPQNALAMAQLALRHEGSDLRPSVSSLTQAFIHDPAVAQQLLRGGIRTEITPTAGSQSARNIGLTNRSTADDGRFNSLSLFNREAGAGLRDNDDAAGYSTGQFLTFSPDARTNLGLVFRGTTSKFGLRGPDNAPDNDDRANFRAGDIGISARRRLGAGQNLWVGLRGATQSNTTRDPDGDSFLTPDNFGISRQDVSARGVLPEVRFDLDVNRGTARAGVLTFGAAQGRTRFNLRGDLPLPVNGVNGELRANERTLSNLVYAQYAGRLSPKFSLIAQVRAQRNNRSQAGSLQILGDTQSLPSISNARTHILPSLLATYQADKKTALRFSYNQRVLDVTTSAFAPNETLLVTQAGAVPYGVPGSMRLAQVDVERYVGRSGFVRLFAFSSAASDLVIGGPDFQGFGGGLPSPVAASLSISGWRGRGIGARVENRFGRNFYLSGGVLSRRARADGYNQAPYEPRLLGDLSLQYLSSSGNKIGVRMRRAGSFLGGTREDGTRERFGLQNSVDLLLARETSVGAELFFNVTNLFGAPQFAFEGYNLGRRRIEFGVTRRF